MSTNTRSAGAATAQESSSFPSASMTSCIDRSKWDVAIVGAGPAGSLAALLCSENGLKSLLVDKQIFPRDKVCGCCLNGRAVQSLRNAGVWEQLVSAGAAPLGNLQICLDRRSLTVPLPDSWAVSRSRLDQTLAQAAVRAGCTFLQGTQATIVPNSSANRIVELTCGSGKSTVEASIVLVCDGLGHPSLSGFSLSGSSHSGDPQFQSVIHPHSRLGLGGTIPAHFRSHLDHTALAQIQMIVGRQGYCGIAPLEDGSLNIAAAVSPEFLKEHEQPLKTIQSLFLEAGVPEPGGLEHATFRGTRPLTQQSNSVAGHRLLLLGDAAGYIEPFTGEGIAWALLSAELAAPLVADVCHAGWQSRHLQTWDQIFRRQILPQRWICRSLSSALQTPWLLRPMLTACRLFPSIARHLVNRMNSVSPAPAPRHTSARIV
jgi:flavin-dependent dehydrogenase